MAGARAWLRVPKPNPSAAWRLICLPHAGGAASFFYPWSPCLPPNGELVAIQYPGREERIDDARLDDMDALVHDLAHALLGPPSSLSKPYVLFGHSMGAAIAYELCLTLQRRAPRPPCLLALSAYEGPGTLKPSALHRADDHVLLAEIIRLNGKLDYLLRSPELMALVLPTLRGDYRLIETYGGRRPTFARVEVPLVVMTGRNDGELSEADARAWERVAGNGFDACSFPGGHFYPSSQASAVIEQIRLRLPRHLRDLPAVP